MGLGVLDFSSLKILVLQLLKFCVVNHAHTMPCVVHKNTMIHTHK